MAFPMAGATAIGGGSPFPMAGATAINATA